MQWSTLWTTSRPARRGSLLKYSICPATTFYIQGEQISGGWQPRATQLTHLEQNSYAMFLFTDFSSAFNAIIPNWLVTKFILASHTAPAFGLRTSAQLPTPWFKVGPPPFPITQPVQVLLPQNSLQHPEGLIPPRTSLVPRWTVAIMSQHWRVCLLSLTYAINICQLWKIVSTMVQSKTNNFCLCNITKVSAELLFLVFILSFHY